MTTNSDPLPPTCDTPPVSDWWQDPGNIRAIREYAHLAGLLVRSSTDNEENHSAMNIAVTLQPSKFPQELYDLAWSIQTDLNELIDAVSRDHEFLEESLQSVIKKDDFTRRLFQLYDRSQASYQPKTVLGIYRSDYLLDYRRGTCPEDATLSIKQIEVNTISTAFTGFSQGGIQNFHKFIHGRYVGGTKPLNIPEPTFVTDGLATAWKQYGKADTFVLFVVEKNDRNVYDQRTIEFDLWNRYQIKSVYKTLEELGGEDCRLTKNQELFVSNLEIALVYYRTAYNPEQYASEKDWSVRLLLECSRAAVCPSLAYQLMGTKKMQQILSVPGNLERFLKDKDKIQKIRSVFTGLYSLDMTEEGDEAVKRALERPSDFVVKPQREGGGHNFYGEDVRSLLQGIKSSEQRMEYILMDRIHPPVCKGLILNSTAEKLELEPLSCELGIFGVYVRCGDDVLLNKVSGSFARSKGAAHDEGGVCVGIGSVDSVDLIPQNEFLKLISKDN